MTPQSDALVFFGATGDLAYKQIFPALHAMFRRGTLSLPIIGVAKSGWTLEQLRERARASISEHGGIDEAAFAQLCDHLQYIDGDYNDPATFTALRQALGGAQHPLHYLAIPPSLFATVGQNLAASGCAAGARIVVEKPFGRDLPSARALNATLHQFFAEQDIFRIDHYLGKEAVQNLVYFRFANSFLEPLLDRQEVASIEINMPETFGVAGRGKFYEEAGAIRDVVQNHLLQVLGLLCMEAPANQGQEALRDGVSRLLKSVRSLTPADVVRGQYEGYTSEEGVAPGSTNETFAAVRLWIDSWRWAGVPVYIRAGKSLPVTATEVTVHFRPPPQQVIAGEEGRHNFLRFRLSPDLAITLGARAKQPGAGMRGQDVELTLHRQSHDDLAPYERLLGDALAGDATLFARQDEVEEAWRIVDPILGNVTPVHPYAPGTWGPAESYALIGADGPWTNPEPAPVPTPTAPATPPAPHGSGENPAPAVVTQAPLVTAKGNPA